MMINLLTGAQGAIKPQAPKNRSSVFNSSRSTIARRTSFCRAQKDEEEGTKQLDSNSDTDLSKLAQINSPPSPPPPRRRSPVGRTTEYDQVEEEERDLFIPIMVILALVGYGATAVIAWLEYEGIFTF